MLSPQPPGLRDTVSLLSLGRMAPNAKGTLLSPSSFFCRVKGHGAAVRWVVRDSKRDNRHPPAATRRTPTNRHPPEAPRRLTRRGGRPHPPPPAARGARHQQARPRGSRLTVTRRGGPGFPPSRQAWPSPPPGCGPPGRPLAAGPGWSCAASPCPGPAAPSPAPRRQVRSRPAEHRHPHHPLHAPPVGPRGPGWSRARQAPPATLLPSRHRQVLLWSPRFCSGSLLSSSVANLRFTRVWLSSLNFSLLSNSSLFHLCLSKNVVKRGHHQLQTVSVLIDAVPPLLGKKQMYMSIF